MLGIMGMDIILREDIESVIKAASRKLGVLNEVRWFYTPVWDAGPALNTGPKLSMDYQEALDRLQQRVVCIINSPLSL